MIPFSLHQNKDQFCSESSTVEVCEREVSSVDAQYLDSMVVMKTSTTYHEW